MQFVFFALQIFEETHDAFVVVFRIAFQNQAPLLFRQVPPRNIAWECRATRAHFLASCNKVR